MNVHDIRVWPPVQFIIMFRMARFPIQKKRRVKVQSKKIDAWPAEDEFDPEAIKREVKAEFGKKLA